MSIMTKRKTNTPDPQDDAKKPKNVKNVGLPIRLWEELERIRQEEDRSINWQVKKAVELYLERRRQRNNGTP